LTATGDLPRHRHRDFFFLPCFFLFGKKKEKKNPRCRDHNSVIEPTTRRERKKKKKKIFFFSSLFESIKKGDVPSYTMCTVSF
jgi:hypothetical protein